MTEYKTTRVSCTEKYSVDISDGQIDVNNEVFSTCPYSITTVNRPRSIIFLS